ncbi:MAG: hypothetical protein IJ131_01340 [Eggerthellaceae bacterium]|nr:hypothetical protein [Eggerthellaceae bacterium]
MQRRSTSDSQHPRNVAAVRATEGTKQAQPGHARARTAQNKGSRFSRTISRFRGYSVRAWVAIMAIGLVVGLAFFARPATSTVEKRELTSFPAFSIDSFLDGSFFTDLSLWYADTYPLREPLVAANQSIKNTYGIQPEVKFVGGNVAADQIGGSSSPSSSEPLSSSSFDSPTSAAAANNWDATDAPDAKPMQEDMQQALMAGLYLKDGAAYNIYYYNEGAVSTYIQAINALAQGVAGQAEVYTVLIPNGSAVLLSQSELDSLGGTDQGEAIAYFYGQFDKSVHPVDTMSELRKHSDEYLYFRTDHHWTQLGANCAYRAFCDTHGFTAQDIETWETKEFDNFLGTFYSETNDPSLVADTVTAHVPPQTNDIVFTDADGNTTESHVINDVSDWGQGTGYYCYGIGDYPLTHVQNPQKTDGSSCLLLKDSYGNCFAPELIGHYQDLYVIDYRYSSTDIVQFVKDQGIDDVVVENNVTIASADAVAGALFDQVTRSGSSALQASETTSGAAGGNTAAANGAAVTAAAVETEEAGTNGN